MSLVMRTFCFSRNIRYFFTHNSIQTYLFLSLAFFLILGFSLNSYTTAQGQYGTYDILDIYEEVDDFSSLSTSVEGKHSHKSQVFQMTDFAGNAMDLFYPQANSNYSAILASPDISMASKMGLIGAVDVPITAMLYNPPYIDIPEHLAQQWIPNYDQTAGIYAQDGHGLLSSQSGVSGLWSVSRNIAYMFFVVVFIIAGFMIMFRHKLQGQTMVSVYNTLPNIIVGLVLVTFSFAIVGLIIDFGAMLIRVISGVLSIANPIDATNPFGVMYQYAGIAGDLLIQSFTDSVLTIVATVLFAGMPALIALLIMLVVVIIIAYISIKIFFTLVKAYIGILFDTIAAPIVFAVATIPGRQPVMKDWFNRVAKNVMIFVLVFTLVNLPQVFADTDGGSGLTMFGGDLGTGNITTGGTVAPIILLGVSVYLLFLAANVPKMLEDYFPQTGGKGSAAAGEGVKKEMGKIPLLGGFFK